MHSFLWPFFPPFFLPSFTSCSLLSFDPSPLPEDSSSCWRRERGRKGRRWWKRLRTPGLSELPPSCCHSFPLLPPNSAFYFTLYLYFGQVNLRLATIEAPFLSIFFLHYIIRFYLSLELLCEPLSAFIHPSRYNLAFYCVLYEDNLKLESVCYERFSTQGQGS